MFEDDIQPVEGRYYLKCGKPDKYITGSITNISTIFGKSLNFIAPVELLKVSQYTSPISNNKKKIIF